MTLKTYLINKISNNRYRLNGIFPSSHLPRKERLCQSFANRLMYSPKDLPPKVDLRNEMTPVEDQSTVGSCVANALAGSYEYLTKKRDGQNTDVSRLFIYYNARVQGNQSNNVEDVGCTMSDAIEALEQFGTCHESVWPYDTSKVNTRPSDAAYRAAVNHKITEALRVDINLNEMKSCLAQGFPFAFGITLFTSFDEAAQSGVVPMPNPGDQSRAAHGYHALLAVGYSDQSRAFIVRNSWGERWGENGYCYIPYDYMTDSNLTFDMWTIRQVPVNDFGRSHWDINDNTNYISEYSHRNNDNANDHEIRVLNDDNNSADYDDTNYYRNETQSFTNDTFDFPRDDGGYRNDARDFGYDNSGIEGNTVGFNDYTDQFRSDPWRANNDYGFQAESDNGYYSNNPNTRRDRWDPNQDDDAYYY